MRARKNELGTPNKTFRAPVVAPCLDLVSTLDDDEDGAADPMGLVGEINRARRAYDQRVAEAAYFLSERRGFEPGRETEDWIAAEAQMANASAHLKSKREEA